MKALLAALLGTGAFISAPAAAQECNRDCLIELADNYAAALVDDDLSAVMPAIHVYKVWGGAIHEIEALGIVMPYQSAHSFAEPDQ